MFADGASGSQVHSSVIAAMTEQLSCGFSNVGGYYRTSENVGLAVDGARAAMADFFHCDASEVCFGPSMTALTFHVSHALEASIGPTDEIVLDPLSHRANVSPWMNMAARRGATVKWLPVSGSGAACTLDTSADALACVLAPGRTRLVAVGAASNGTGTVHDVAGVCTAARAAGALSYVDAVHYAAHHPVDVRAWGCTFAACSPYKFFGPHAGCLYGAREPLSALPFDRLDVQDDGLPSEANCWMSRAEIGTQCHEALAGITACVDYLASLGSSGGGDGRPSGPPGGGGATTSGRRARLLAGWRRVEAHEEELKRAMLEGLVDLNARAKDGRGGCEVQLLGVHEPAPADRPARRTPTFAIAKEGVDADRLVQRLCAAGVWCTSGNHYASLWDEHSGGRATTAGGGMARLGFLHYNTADEIERVLAALREA